MVRRLVRQFVDSEVTPYCHEWDEAKQVPCDMMMMMI
jgi:hypothetical protein